MPRFIYVFGEPSTGKSTLVKSVLKGKSVTNFRKHGLVWWTEYAGHNLIAMGDYRNEADEFPGTDRFSFQCQRTAIEAIGMLAKEYQTWTIIAEGDRLAGSTFFRAIQDAGYEFVPLVVKCSPDTILARNQKRLEQRRKPVLDSSWLRGRRTKYANAQVTYGAIVVSNNSLEELEAAVSALRLLVSPKLVTQ